MQYLETPWAALAAWAHMFGRVMLWTAFIGATALTVALAIPVGRIWFAGYDFHPLRGLLGASAAVAVGSGLTLLML